MKRTTFYLVFLLGVGLFSFAGQRNTNCDRKPAPRIIVTEQMGEQRTYTETGMGFGPLSYFLTGF
jgi:hypothetical protein